MYTTLRQCVLYSYPQKCLLKSEKTELGNKMYSTLDTCYSSSVLFVQIHLQ